MANDNQAPATKQDLKDTRNDILQNVAELIHESEDKTRELIHESEDKLLQRVAELIHESETKLLGAFFNYEENAQAKYRKLKADVSNLDAASELRLANIENRLTAVEKKLLMNGHQ